LKPLGVPPALKFGNAAPNVGDGVAYAEPGKGNGAAEKGLLGADPFPNGVAAGAPKPFEGADGCAPNPFVAPVG
jgi:hypothetical protein